MQPARLAHKPVGLRLALAGVAQSVSLPTEEPMAAPREKKLGGPLARPRAAEPVAPPAIVRLGPAQRNSIRDPFRAASAGVVGQVDKSGVFALGVYGQLDGEMLFAEVEGRPSPGSSPARVSDAISSTSDCVALQWALHPVAPS